MVHLKKRRWMILPLLGISILFLLYLIIFTKESPIQDLEKARLAISRANKSGAAKYSPLILSHAQELYSQAMDEWSSQNKRFITTRDYDRTHMLAREASAMAEMSLSSSKVVSSRIQRELLKDIDSLKTELDSQKTILALLPLSAEMKKLEATGSLKLTEAELSYNSANYLLAEKQLRLAERSYQRLFEDNQNLINSYFRDYGKWQDQIRAAVKASKKNQSVLIIIDKVSHLCLVYSKGNLLYSFPAEFGKNWLGTKKHQGDKATPEGLYNVRSRFSGSQTRYYRALLISYPNEDDQKRFEQNRQNGLIPEGKEIGGLVEIHGNGGKGFDWTDGCVALNDRDADKIYRISKVGTPVVIVGSTKSLDELLKK